jgi:hypothetical protein
MGPNLGGGWDTTDWGTLDYYRPDGTYGDIGDFSPLSFGRYRTRAIISHGLCIIFTPFFTGVYNQERLILETIYEVNKEVLHKNLWFQEWVFQES